MLWFYSLFLLPGIATCICTLLLGNPSHDMGDQGGHKVVGVGKPTTENIIVIQPWENTLYFRYSMAEVMMHYDADQTKCH